MFGLGAGELFLIFMIAILFLGPKKIPELAKGLGQAIREFEKAKAEMHAEINKKDEPNHVAQTHEHNNDIVVDESKKTKAS